jgi:hypothetical protein
VSTKKAVLDAAERYAAAAEEEFSDLALRNRCLLWALQSAGPNPDPGAVVFAAEVYRCFLAQPLPPKPKPTVH